MKWYAYSGATCDFRSQQEGDRYYRRSPEAVRSRLRASFKFYRIAEIIVRRCKTNWRSYQR